MLGRVLTGLGSGVDGRLVFFNSQSQEEIMETFKKRQKAWARKEKQQQKAARRMERRNEKAKSEDKPAADDAQTAEPRVQQ
jgi:hypothetical protein